MRNRVGAGSHRNRIAVACALVAPAAVLLTLAPFRASFHSVDAALVLVAVVVAIAASGFRVAGLLAALVTGRQHAIAAAVRGVAGELGASASQVALAWTMTRSRAVHPILGVRRLDQLQDNLQALSVQLPPESVTQLEAATFF
jgi:hypothetical protein